MNFINQIWDFFASVKLAIFTLSTLAITSIIGTIIPQGESSSFYISKYGAKSAQFMRILDIPEMYYSWWFLALLGLLTCNLLICSAERFPRVWKIITRDNYDIDPDRLSKMSNSKTWNTKDTNFSITDLQTTLDTCGWSFSSKEVEHSTLFFSQKGKWSRTGVYIVHLSIIVIFIGAIIGHLGGFKGSVMLPELRSTGKIFSTEDQSAIDLGFELRCNRFTIDFYDNGMPKEYMSSLTVLENDKEVLTTDIEVNGPLTYKGITFYQSSYQGYQSFIFKIIEEESGESTAISVPYQKKGSWEDKDIHFGVVTAEALGQRAVRSKIWVKAGNHSSITSWLEDNTSTTLAFGGKNYTVHTKQMYATGLQVAKDPGVWVVYLGCGLMLVGLYMAFFMSHRRLWLLREESEKGTTLTLAGNSNKNRIAFGKQFQLLEKYIEDKLQT